LPPERGPPSDDEDQKEDRSVDDDAPTDVLLKTAYPSRLPERPSNIRLPGGPTSKAKISGPRSPQKSPQKSVKKSSAIAAASSEEVETKGTTRQNGGTTVTSPRKSPVKKAKSEDNKEARKGKKEARGDPPEDNDDKQE
jgi:hypothetical protein